MTRKHVIIIGGRLAGLSAGCYARASGFQTTIVEHNLALGGVCTAWPRGAYLVDGCIHWLTGGPFARIYQELGILPAVQLKTIEDYATYRHAHDAVDISITRDLQALGRALERLAPSDMDEIQRIIAGAREIAEIDPRVDHPAELAHARDTLSALWHMRHEAGTLVHFRKPSKVWIHEHVKSPRLARVLAHLVPPEAPMMFLLMVLGYLERGWLSRPVGGTASFRDALIKTYERLGGEARLHTTVDEVLVENDRATGVRLGDGAILGGDVVISTSSAPETVLRLLGGRYDAEPTRKRMRDWKMFDPIVLASFGVEKPLTDAPALLFVDGIHPFEMGGRSDDALYVRVCNDDPCFAPPGHSVVQLMAATSYEWWATRGARYRAEKDAVATLALQQLESLFPGLSPAVRMIDVATPLTYWAMSRSWRGSYEGWMPADGSFGHIRKTLTGLSGFYMAGQWVEPGGGVPSAVMSGRQVTQIICEAEGCAFVPTPGAVASGGA